MSTPSPKRSNLNQNRKERTPHTNLTPLFSRTAIRNNKTDTDNANPNHNKPTFAAENVDPNQPKPCISCNRTDHSTRANQLCPYNKKYKPNTCYVQNTQPKPINTYCYCGSSTHKRRSHRDCSFNPKNMTAEENLKNLLL